MVKNRDIQNNVKRPKQGSITEKVWCIADAISKQHRRPATKEEVLNKSSEEGINIITAGNQYGKWCKYNGLS